MAEVVREMGTVTRVGPLAVKMAAEADVCPARTGD